MKNKGLLTRSRILPLGSHKEPIPEVLPGRVDADIQGETPNEEIETKGQDQLSAPSKAPAAIRSGRSSTAAAKGGARFTLHLKVDQTIQQAVDKYFTGMDAAQKTVAKQAMMRSFRKVLLDTKPKKAAYNPTKPVNFRVDILIPHTLQEAIMEAEEATVFEAPTPVLIRNISPIFAKFIKQSLGK